MLMLYRSCFLAYSNCSGSTGSHMDSTADIAHSRYLEHGGDCINRLCYSGATMHKGIVYAIIPRK